METEINFCEMPEEKLSSLVDLIGISNDPLSVIMKKSEAQQKIISNRIVEIRWNFYDTIIVKPEKITIEFNNIGSKEIITAERYLKFLQFFQKYENNK